MKADKKQIVICGNYGIGNLGDEAILDGLIRLTESCWPGAEIRALSSHPQQTAREHGIKAVPLFPAGLRSTLKFWISGQAWKTIRTVRRADLVILGGGGLFTDDKWQAVWIWAVQAWWFRLLGRPYVCLAQSVGPLRTRSGRSLAAGAFRRAKMITVRDRQSAQVLADLGIGEVSVMSDAAFALGFEAPRARNIQQEAVLSLRNWSTEKKMGQWKAVAAAIDWLWLEKGIRTLFIAFQEAGDDDRTVYTQLRELVKETKALEIKVVEDYQQTLEIIGRSRLVIGMRLHSLIFAALGCRPFLGISYSSKVMAMADELGMANFCQRFGELTSQSIIEGLKKIFIHENELIALLERKKLQNTYRFFEHEKALRKLL